MNDIPNIPVPPATPALPQQPPHAPLSDEPLPGDATLRNVIDALLKHPHQIATEAGGSRQRALIVVLAVTAIAGFAIYGLLTGMLSGGRQLWAAPLKITFGAFAAGLLCFPSLHIFCCLAGIDTGPGKTLGILTGMLALTAILLVGFAPVIWVFSMSTESIGFMGALHILFWFIAAYFGLGFLLKGFGTTAPDSRGHLVVWCLIFVVVTLQMTCALRPIIGTADTLLPNEKQFFLTHWGESLGD